MIIGKVEFDLEELLCGPIPQPEFRSPFAHKDCGCKECKKIITFSKSVLNKAIQKGGSSIRDFKNTLGESGNFQKEFKVYQREKRN